MSSRRGRRAGSASRTRSYRGRVISGRGIMGRVLGELTPQISEKLGVPVVDGSLNLILRRPVRLRDSTALTIEDGKRRFWPASVSGTPVWVYRWVGATEHVVELVAEQHLRSAMHLSDGDTLTVNLNLKDVESMTPIRYIAWAILWLGRTKWYYTSDSYLRRVGAVMGRTIAVRNGLRRVAKRVTGAGGVEPALPTSTPPEADIGQPEPGTGSGDRSD